MKLNKSNIDNEIISYLNSVNTVDLPESIEDRMIFMESIKRKPLGTGPYPGVSLFEASNRILSDIVVLFGVHRLLHNPLINHIRLPFMEYDVALGVEGGNDLVATTENKSLFGEVFNVAPSFFQAKKTAMIRKLRAQSGVDYMLLIFNSDAVSEPEAYFEKSEVSMMYLPINIWEYRDKFSLK